MKKTNILCVLALLLSTMTFAQVGIGTTMPDASAALDIKATGTAVGLLLPNLSDVNRDANILSPAAGLVIYNTTTKSVQFVNNAVAWFDALTGNTIAAAGGSRSSTGKVGIGTTIPDKNAILDVDSTTQGVLLPVLASEPAGSAEGMMYYNTADNDVKLYNGSSWVVLTNKF
jgi:hypothetical protein